MKELLEHLYFLTQYLTEKDSETVTALCLMDLGFPANKQSFKYIKTAVILFKEKPDQLLVYELYPNVAKKFPMAAKTQVEIAIRREINRQWKNRDVRKWNMYFPNGITKRDTGPSNADFLSGMVQLLVLWEKCCKNYRKRVREQLEEGT